MKKFVDLKNDNIVKLVFHFALPMMLAQFINVLYSIIDRIFIGNIPEIGDVALAGVGVCAPLTTFITSFACWVGLGGAPLFSIALGEKNKEKAQKILNNSFILLVILSVVVMLITFIFRKPILLNFGAKEGTSFIYANQYLTVYCCGIIFSILALGLNQFIAAQGFTQIAMSSTIAGALTNIALDAILIQVFKMGVFGAALATVIAQFISFLIAIIFLFSKRALVKIEFKNYDLKLMKTILIMGLSPFIIAASDSFVLIILNASLQRFGGDMGDNWLTVSTITQSYFALCTMPLLGISSGTQPLLAYNYGARDADRLKKCELTIVLFALVFNMMSFGLAFVLSKPFARIFTDNEWIITNSQSMIMVFMSGIIILTSQYCFIDGLTALAQPQYAIVLSLFRKILMILLFILIPMNYSAGYTFYGEPIADFISSTVSLIVFVIVFPKIIKKRVNS